jgi:hypothetical protein
MQTMTVPRFFRGKVNARASKMTRAETEAMCRRIEGVWHDAGHSGVSAWVRMVSYKYRSPRTGEWMVDETYTVASNLVNGLPPGTLYREAA